MAQTDKKEPLMCHFKPMKYQWGDNGSIQEEWFECSVCGCVKTPEGKKLKQT
jgi:hypothetical protein